MYQIEKYKTEHKKNDNDEIASFFRDGFLYTSEKKIKNKDIIGIIEQAINKKSQELSNKDGYFDGYLCSYGDYRILFDCDTDRIIDLY